MLNHFFFLFWQHKDGAIRLPVMCSWILKYEYVSWFSAYHKSKLKCHTVRRTMLRNNSLSMLQNMMFCSWTQLNALCTHKHENGYTHKKQKKLKLNFMKKNFDRKNWVYCINPCFFLPCLLLTTLTFTKKFTSPSATQIQGGHVTHISMII